jgi:hypothetical protein
MIGEDRLMHPSDEQLLQWKNRSEDNFVERKTVADTKDWLKTVVAFANSAPYDKCGVLYIGIRDDGSIEQAVNLDELQKTLRRRVDDAFPPITYSTRVLIEGGRDFLCGNRAGKSQSPALRRSGVRSPGFRNRDCIACAV